MRGSYNDPVIDRDGLVSVLQPERWSLLTSRNPVVSDQTQEGASEARRSQPYEGHVASLVQTRSSSSPHVDRWAGSSRFASIPVDSQGRQGCGGAPPTRATAKVAAPVPLQVACPGREFAVTV